MSPMTAAWPKPSARKIVEHLVDASGRAGDEQPAAGLRVGEQRLARLVDAPARA